MMVWVVGRGSEGVEEVSPSTSAQTWFLHSDMDIFLDTSQTSDILWLSPEQGCALLSVLSPPVKGTRVWSWRSGSVLGCWLVERLFVLSV